MKPMSVVLGIILVGIQSSQTGTALGQELKTQKKLRVLVVTGGHAHDEAEFKQMFRDISGIECDHQKHPQALKTLTTDAARAFDVVVLYDMYQPITDQQKKAYEKLIHGGMGLVVLHHALANFQNWPTYERIVGGKFFFKKRVENGVEKPASGYKHDVDIKVEVAEPDHYITRGLEDFVIHDETYNRLRVDPAVHVLLRSNNPTSHPVLGWVKPFGKARVVCLQLGHDKHAYANPSYETLVARSIRWVARRTPGDAGMVQLFNGKDLGGWSAKGNARFSVEDGVLVGRQGPGGAAGDLFSDAQFDDFELEATWAMTWPGNSGIWFRFADSRKAYQADILEYKKPLCWSGSLYCMAKAFIALNEDPSIVRRHGWNTFRIRAEKDHLLILLNGRKVADVRDDSSSRGRFGIQVHSGAPFANMAIRVADLRVKPIE